MVNLENHSARPIGSAIRARREALALSLQDVADRVGCAKSYLSAIETDRRGAPSDELLAKLESALGLPAGALLQSGRWERSLRAGGESVQRDVAQMEADRRAGKRLAELLSKAREGQRGLDAIYKSGELRRLISQLTESDGGAVPVALAREVPVINFVAAGRPTEFTDLGYPARVADTYVRCPELEDADAFAARVSGDSMEPVYREGDIVVFSPSRALQSGMDCFARLAPDNEITFKRVYFETSAGGVEMIRLQPLNAVYAARVVGREEVLGLYGAVSVIKKIG